MKTKEKMQIMIIDDNVTNLNFARMALEGQYDLLLIPSGEEVPRDCGFICGYTSRALGRHRLPTRARRSSNPD